MTWHENVTLREHVTCIFGTSLSQHDFLNRGIYENELKFDGKCQIFVVLYLNDLQNQNFTFKKKLMLSIRWHRKCIYAFYCGRVMHYLDQMHLVLWACICHLDILLRIRVVTRSLSGRCQSSTLTEWWWWISLTDNNQICMPQLQQTQPTFLYHDHCLKTFITGACPGITQLQQDFETFFETFHSN